MLMASLQDEAIAVLMRLPEVDALWKRFPGLSPAEHQAAFLSATRPLGEDIRSFANRLEDIYDQGYTTVDRDTREQQLLVKIRDAVLSNVTDILFARNCRTFAEAVQVIYLYDQTHGTVSSGSSQAPVRTPGTHVHRCASQPVQETDQRSPSNITLQTHQEEVLHATPEEIADYQAMVAQALGNLASGETSQSSDSVEDGFGVLLAAMSQAAQGNFWEIFSAQMASRQQKNTFKCFFCNKPGHRWLACNQLWDVLKTNGFVSKAQRGSKKGSQPSKKPKTDPPQSN